MSKPPAPCSKCKGEMSMTVLEPFEGEEEGVRLTIQAMPCVECAQQHKRFINLAFAGDLLDLMMSPETFRNVPAATKKGFFSKRYHCPDCAAELPEAPTGEQSQEVAAELKNAQPFRVAVRFPVYKCGGCGGECIRSVEDAAKLAFKATGHAFRSIDIHPT
jgi:hypothetical protein